MNNHKSYKVSNTNFSFCALRQRIPYLICLPQQQYVCDDVEGLQVHDHESN